MKQNGVISIILFLLIACLLVSACNSASDGKLSNGNDDSQPKVTSEPVAEIMTPAPTEEPVIPWIGVVLSGNNEEIVTKIREYSGLDVSEETVDSLSDITDFTAVVLCIEEPIDEEEIKSVLDMNLPVIAYNKCGQELPASIIQVKYEGGFCRDYTEMMETIIQYPPHDTPVRLLGVFSSEEGEAKQVWDSYIDAGKVISKGTFTGSVDGGFDRWISEVFGDFYPGMVDAAYVDNADLALSFAKAMVAADRDDFEIFTIGSNTDLSAISKTHPRLVPVMTSYDDDKAAHVIADLLSAVHDGQIPENVILDAA